MKLTKKAMSERQRFWLRHIETAARSGQGLKQYAKAHGLPVGSLYNAKSIFKRADALDGAGRGELVASDFVPVRIAAPSSRPIRCRLQHVSGWQLEMERLPDPQWLRALLSGEVRDAAS